MRLHHLFFVAVFGLAGATLASADTVPGHFIVNLNDNPSCTTDCTGSWTSDLSATPFSTVNIPTGLSGNICFDSDANEPNADEPDCDNDPRIQLLNGGASTGVTGPFTVSPVNGGGIFDYQNNTGAPINELVFETTYVPGDSYTCSTTGGPFAHCGFLIVGDPDIKIFFYGGAGIPSVPEPSEYLFLLSAFTAVAGLHRLRSRKSSS